MKELRAEAILELGDLPAHARLGHPERSGRAAKASRLIMPDYEDRRDHLLTLARKLVW